MGVYLAGTDATITRSVVRNTATSSDGYSRGIDVEPACPNGECADLGRSTATIYGTLVEESHEIGIAILSSDATIEASLVRATHATPAAILGDGITADGTTGPSRVIVRWTRIEHSERAALSSFSADVTLGASLLLCQSFALDGENVGGLPYSFHDEGGNVCDCAALSGKCRATSSQLAGPKAVSTVK
jgi:hypothetical protein